MAFSCIKASPEKRGLFTLQVCSSHYWYTDYDYATAILVGAGNTTSSAQCVILKSVYPRWRGEHLGGNFTRHDGYGLSPLARGTRRHAKTPGDDVRFIPAGAGNTYGFSLVSRSFPVYPRWRGEHYNCQRLNRGGPGLSPLARGTLRTLSNTNDNDRFIPAGAGNTVRRSALTGLNSVYPRWRGEHNIIAAFKKIRDGLSPLARGTLISEVLLI